jgi:hypothetical protein
MLALLSALTGVPTLDVGSSSIRVALSPLSLGKFIDKKSFPESCEESTW